MVPLVNSLKHREENTNLTQLSQRREQFVTESSTTLTVKSDKDIKKKLQSNIPYEHRAHLKY